MNVKDKFVVIIGATGGIGSMLSEKLSREGAKLLLVGRNKSKVEKLISQGNQFYEIDITDPTQIQSFVEKIKEKHIDFLINAAGIGIYKPLEETTHKDWKESFATNVTAPFLFIKGLLPLLQKSADSLVLNIGSGAGVIPMKNRSVYSASKFALRGLTLSLAEEFVGHHPQICLITLGSTLTNFAGIPVEKKRE